MRRFIVYGLVTRYGPQSVVKRKRLSPLSANALLRTTVLVSLSRFVQFVSAITKDLHSASLFIYLC